jgi:hypothetical protein
MKLILISTTVHGGEGDLPAAHRRQERGLRAGPALVRALAPKCGWNCESGASFDQVKPRADEEP